MKKSVVFIVFIFLGFTAINAQVSFRPGLRAGANFSNFTEANYNNSNSLILSNEFKNLTNFYIGFYGQVKINKFYTLQPEINYSNQGSSIKWYDSSKFIDYNVSYLSLTAINKFSVSNQFNIQLGTSLDFVMDKNFKIDGDRDATFVLGAGYEFTKNFGLEARVKKGLSSVFKDDSGSHFNIVFSLGAAYTFDQKK